MVMITNNYYYRNINTSTPTYATCKLTFLHTYKWILKKKKTEKHRKQYSSTKTTNTDSYTDMFLLLLWVGKQGCNHWCDQLWKVMHAGLHLLES